MKKGLLLSILIISQMSLILAIDVLTLPEAKEIVLNQNLDYLSLQASQDKADYQEKSAFTSFLPTANVTGNHTRYEPDLMQSGEYANQITLSVTQPLLANGSIYYNNKIAKQNAYSSQLSVQDKRIEVLNQLEVLYYNSLETKNNLSILESSYEQAWKSYQAGITKYQQKIISREQLLRLQVEATNKALAVLDGQNSYNDAYRDLKTYLNTRSDFELADVDFSNEAEDFQTLRSVRGKFFGNSISEKSSSYQLLLDRLVDLTAEKNSQIALAESQKKIATYSLNQQKSSYLPSLNLSLNKNWTASQADSDFSDQTTMMLNASLNIFPLFNKYYNVSAQKMNLKSVNYNYQALLSQIESQLETSLDKYFTALDKIDLAEQTLLLNEEIFAQRKTKFEANLISVDDYLDALIDLEKAQEQYNSSLYGFLKSGSNLRQVIGLEDNEDLTKIINLVAKEIK